MTKRLTLCADDFAQSGSISAGILQLLDAGRLSATSVMSQSPHWPALAGDLKARARRADIGLHFNLTHGFDTPAKPLSHWLMKSQLRQLSQPALRDEALSQIDRFAEHFGQLPDFVDGHQHVHALPVIRDALFDAILRRWPQGQRPYLRAPDKLGHPGDNRLKSLILRSVCINFNEQAQEHGFATAPWFGGMYSLSPQADFAGLMQAWLARAPDQALIMCHPGLPASDAEDPIAASRSREFDYLISDAFGEHCRRHQVEIGRFQPAAVAA
ncbi:ChbG/HpnK family deacetylase [Chromobacterium sphagni]|uniref:Cellobiose phosphorylase n=1 Tax=Chromobacterium sphagni TaxID=1903179 RepID=A0A1S1X3N8_9NEIS|nr:ChbG/HpnK family deacetylase [Chromobacterium sphagni]OHX14102.1 cellobiose phosphorylase [Chromobacterium sphagni]OHX20311.1 cellobiose phosphorylase [Chromobacterium sphagni]